MYMFICIRKIQIKCILNTIFIIGGPIVPQIMNMLMFGRDVQKMDLTANIMEKL